jgi:hypothetical protein
MIQWYLWKWLICIVSPAVVWSKTLLGVASRWGTSTSPSFPPSLPSLPPPRSLIWCIQLQFSS